MTDITKAAQAAQPQQTTIYCAEKRKPGGCQLHNLHCGWPKCNEPPKKQAAQPVAWCDDGALAGGVGSVASAATKQYWARGDRVDRETAARLKHPLYAAAQPQQAEQTVWRGAARCDMCKKVITRNLYDAATRHGPWATMCASCFSFHGLGVGTGRGQQYRQQPDGLFVKIAG